MSDQPLPVDAGNVGITPEWRRNLGNPIDNEKVEIEGHIVRVPYRRFHQMLGNTVALREEVERLSAQLLQAREALAYEARVLEAHYEGYKTFPKSRLPYAKEQVERMRALARGEWPEAVSTRRLVDEA